MEGGETGVSCMRGVLSGTYYLSNTQSGGFLLFLHGGYEETVRDGRVYMYEQVLMLGSHRLGSGFQKRENMVEASRYILGSMNVGGGVGEDLLLALASRGELVD